MELNTIAVVLMEAFALLYFLMVFLSKRYSHSLNSLKNKLKNEGNGAWSFNFLFPTKHVISPSTLLMTTITIAIFFIGIILTIALAFAGYVFFICLIGLEILLDTDAFEAYRYCRAVQKIQEKEPNLLNLGDRRYLDEVKETLEMSVTRFTLTGVVFAAAGPFIPQILHSTIYGLVLYVSMSFEVTKAFSFLGILVVTLLFAFSLILIKKLIFKISEKLRTAKKGNDQLTL